MLRVFRNSYSCSTVYIFDRQRMSFPYESLVGGLAKLAILQLYSYIYTLLNFSKNDDASYSKLHSVRQL